jgi:hypothetical protein
MQTKLFGIINVDFDVIGQRMNRYLSDTRDEVRV